MWHKLWGKQTYLNEYKSENILITVKKMLHRDHFGLNLYDYSIELNRQFCSSPLCVYLITRGMI